MNASRITTIVAASFLIFAAAARAQRGDPATLIAAQREALKPLVIMDGVWRGPAWTILPSGEKHHVMQTERIGPFLDSSVKVIEGRGYDVTRKKVAFNALGVLSYDPQTKKYFLHSYAQGYSGDFTLTPTADGYIWEIPMGPMTIRYTAVIKNNTWHEWGDRFMPGAEPVRFFDMTLKRIGNTKWPSGGAIPMR
ncbi:MAG: DUF1579 domain-containing protein [Gemmatimonadaceae bacterium]|nr:DUF1579 domain-containing protein [Gemmatimonadaceae bacterium]